MKAPYVWIYFAPISNLLSSSYVFIFGENLHSNKMFSEMFVNFHIFSVNLKQIQNENQKTEKIMQFPTLYNPNNIFWPKTKYQNQCSWVFIRIKHIKLGNFRCRVMSWSFYFILFCEILCSCKNKWWKREYFVTIFTIFEKKFPKK